MAISELVKAWEVENKRRLESVWAVGFMDRGHGHGSFAVILKDDEMADPEENFCLKCQDRGMAEHIVKLHNDSLK